MGGINISDIVLAAGYNDLSNFHRAFKQKFAETPAVVASVCTEIPRDRCNYSAGQPPNLKNNINAVIEVVGPLNSLI